MATTETGERRALDELAEARPLASEVRHMAERHRSPASACSGAARPAATQRGSGQLFSVPYRYGSDDIDLDRTLEVLTERPVPEDTDIVVRERMRSRRAVALLVDVSGSMRGEKVPSPRPPSARWPASSSTTSSSSSRSGSTRC